jgi:energy-coupling factor transporter ATP-binding protein EcfA2
LQILGLSSKAEMLTKSLTNGELKSVSVGMGMISNPNVLFLDEPTTGLDSNAAYTIVKYLTELCTVTKVVMIMTIHQPAQMVFDMLQDLYLLENGGRLAYAGPVNRAESYFASIGGKEIGMGLSLGGFRCPSGVNVCDFYLDLVNTSPTSAYEQYRSPQKQLASDLKERIAGSWSELFLQSSSHQAMELTLVEASDSVRMVNNSLSSSSHPVSTASYLHRLWLTVVYFAKYYYRDYTLFHVRIVFLIVIALFLGTLFYDLKPVTSMMPQYSGSIYFSAWTTMAGAIWATKAHAQDRVRVLEQMKNDVMTPSVYCIAQFLVSLLPFLLIAVIFQSIYHWLTNLNGTAECFVYVICITFGNMLVMEAILLCVVGVLHNAMLSITFVLVIMGALFLFPGFLVSMADMPVWIRWLCYLMPTKVRL